MTRGEGAGCAPGAQALRGRARGAQQEPRACMGARTGATSSWARGFRGARARERAAANAAAGETSGCTGVQGRAGCTATRQPCAATRPGGSATTRPRARRLCAQAGPIGPGWGFVHSDSVFGTGLTRYFS